MQAADFKIGLYLANCYPQKKKNTPQNFYPLGSNIQAALQRMNFYQMAKFYTQTKISLYLRKKNENEFRPLGGG